jgi:heme-degrading monooxygenase HmoA
MHARVTHFQLRPGTADEYKQYSQNVVIPRLKQVPGLKRAVVLQNDATGKTLTIALMETEEDRQALATTDFFREFHVALAHVFTVPAVVEHYELVAQDTRGEKLPAYARFASIQVHLDKIDEAIDFTHNAIALNKQEPGFAGAWILVDRQNNKILPIHFWETEAAMQARETSGALQKAVTQSAHLQAVPLTMEVSTVSIQA